MIVVLLLGGWVVLAGFLAPLLLSRLSFDRTPAAGVALWQALSASVVIALLLPAAAFTVGTESVSHWFATVVRACEEFLRSEYASPAGSGGTLVGVALGALILTRLAMSAYRETRAHAARRRAWTNGLAAVARRDAGIGALVLPHHVPAAYSAPGGRGGEVVVTTAATALLTPEELRAVVAHERSHLRWRHHAVVACAAVVLDALPWIPLLRHAHTHTQRLIELMADDGAAPTHQDRQALDRALGTIAATSPSTTARRRRLAAPARRGRVATGGAVALSGVSVAAPAMLLVAPVLVSALSVHCTLALHC